MSSISDLHVNLSHGTNCIMQQDVKNMTREGAVICNCKINRKFLLLCFRFRLCLTSCRKRVLFKAERQNKRTRTSRRRRRRRRREQGQRGRGLMSRSFIFTNNFPAFNLRSRSSYFCWVHLWQVWRFNSLLINSQHPNVTDWTFFRFLL